MNRLIIIGSRGFIGSHLVKNLRKKYTIVGINRNPDHECQHSFCCDISNPSEISQYLCDMHGDILINCAAISDPRPEKGKSARIIDTNIKSAVNISEWFTGSYIINLSSIVIYGQYTRDFKPSEEEACHPKSIYAVSKLSAEQIFNVYSNFGQFEVCHLRLPAIVGEHMTHGAVSAFINRLKNETEFFAIGKKPGSTKPYLYISDLLRAIELAINSRMVGSFNVVPDDSISIESVITACQGALGTNKKIIWKDENWKGDNELLCADNSKIKGIGWKPYYQSYDAVFKATIDNLG